MVVGVTASNMRSSPGEMKFVSYEIDENQLSQALFYESIYMLVALSASLFRRPFVLCRFLSLPSFFNCCARLPHFVVPGRDRV